MPEPARIVRAAAAAVFAAAWASSAFAQPILLRGASTGTGPSVSVTTYAGTVSAAIAPVDVSKQVLVVLLVDTIPPEQRESVRSALQPLFRANDLPDMRLAALRGGDFAVEEPFRTRTRLQAALRRSLSPSGTEPAPQPAAKFYQWLSQAAGQLGSGWSTVILIGSVPDVDTPVRDYATVYVASRFQAQKVRLSYWNPAAPVPTWFGDVCRATGGSLLADGLNPPGASMEAGGTEAPVWQEVTWQPPTGVRGFLLYRAKLTFGSVPALEFPAVAMHAGLEMPDLDAYANLRRNAETARQLAEVQKPTDQQAAQMRDVLAQALHINPSDPDILRLATDFYARSNDYAAAAGMLTVLAEINPKDAKLMAELGHAHFVAHQLAQAEPVLLRARENGADTARVSEELARIHLGRSDDSGAMPFLDESLKKDPKQAALWYERADAAGHLKEWRTQTESLERGLALDSRLDRRTALVRLYLDHQENDQALLHVRLAIAALPNDAKVVQTYAGFFDELHRPADALAWWRKVLELDGTVEQAHFRVTRLLADKGALAEALQAADAGLAAAPKSARLYVLKSEILEKQGSLYAARFVLRQSAASLDDPGLLRRLSELEDMSGKAAARSYLRLAEVLEKQPAAAPDYRNALERCRETALRDNDAPTAQKCAARLAKGGGQSGAGPALQKPENRASGAVVPGGLEALAFIAHSKPRMAPERFFVEYSKAIRLNKQGNDKAAALYFDAIRAHFELVSALEALGQRDHEKVRITVSLKDKKAQRQTERILDMLGWKLRVSKGEVTLDAGEKVAQAKRQETTSALAIDAAGMQEALQSRKDFTIELQDDWAPVLFGADTWKQAFYPKDEPPGGFAGALARDARLAKLYAGLSAMEKDAAAALLAQIGLKTLADKYADLEYLFSAALAIHQGHAAVPGGPAAEPIWRKMAGASPDQPGPFFKALLDKDDGKLLSFYATLAQLDLRHQQFFTRNASRTGKFYELYRQAPEIARGASKEVLSSSFFDVLREVPLNPDESVDFPGSPEVWLVAKGQVNSVERTNKLLKKVSKTAAPEEEDEILLRLARTRYKAIESELDNFVAVVRIDAHRSDPLDEASALLLANHSSRSRAIYPYFASLTSLTYEDFASFFTMTEKLESLPVVEMNTVWGEFHALARLLCLDQESGRLSGKKAAELFRQICDRFGSAAAPADFAAASLDVMRRMLQEAGAGTAPPDDAVRTMLFGPPGPVTFQIDGVSLETDWVAKRDKDFRHVYELQKVTPLALLYEIYDAAAKLSAGQGDASAAVKIIETATAALPVVEVPKTLKANGKRRENLAVYQPKKVADLVAKLGKSAAKRKSDKKEIERLCRELLAEINVPVRLALTGIVYAYYFRPEDLLISEDPLFLRKHEFVDLDSGGRPDLFGSAPELEVSSEGEGSYLKGGFAGFSAVVGRVAGKGTGGNAEMVLASQVGSLRNTYWPAISERDMLLYGLKIRLSREWLVRAAGQPELLAALSEATLGTLSLSRRADLLNGIQAADWKAVWQSVTLSDLYSLADEYLERFKTDPWDSQVTRAIRKVPATDLDGLDLLGGSHPYLNGCDHSHLLRLAPYEQYERLMLPMMMAERVTELKLYLIDYAGQAGIPAEALAMVAEPLALETLHKLRMADTKDWRPVPLAFSSLDEEKIVSALKNYDPQDQ